MGLFKDNLKYFFLQIQIHRGERCVGIWSSALGDLCLRSSALLWTHQWTGDDDDHDHVHDDDHVADHAFSGGSVHQGRERTGVSREHSQVSLQVDDNVLEQLSLKSTLFQVLTFRSYSKTWAMLQYFHFLMLMLIMISDNTCWWCWWWCCHSALESVLMLITFDQAESELDADFPADSKSSADSGPSTGSWIRSRARLFWYRSICTPNAQPRSRQSLLCEPQPNTETNAKPNTEANTKPNTDANALQAFSPPVT